MPHPGRGHFSLPSAQIAEVSPKRPHSRRSCGPAARRYNKETSISARELFVKRHIRDSNFSLCDEETCLRVAVVQFSRDRDNPPLNRRRMAELLGRISDVDVALPPEAWLGRTIIKNDELESILGEFGGIAADKGITLLTGGLFVDTGQGTYDICHIIGPDGNVVDEVAKVFPSLPVGERAFCSAGTRMPVFEVAGVKAGVIVCVDMMYPELVRSLADRGAEVVFNPSNIPQKRIPMWHSLITVRAAENTVFTVFACNTGTVYPDNRAVMGGSAAAHPFGVLLFEAGHEEEIHVVELETCALPKIRERWPYLEDYREIEKIDGDSVKKRN